MYKFKAKLEIIGINPFVFVPDVILNELFGQVGKDKGPIPISGSVNGEKYIQTLVKYRGEWRLYVNTRMLKNSPDRIGEMLEVTVAFDPSERTVDPHPKLLKALKENPEAKKVFDALPTSRRREIIKYISFLKTEKSIEKNVARAIGFLLGKERFIGRDRP
ncbi:MULTISPECIES: YdeI/OmpD-associated family protein [unclassified Arenibacter]|uniref:YdeI/OmpD-associated family protein n=1 Tax=unclassified Arenibacter TaxID=2615047 RepID=UPI000E34801E|nr:MULTISPECIES: YdeI/OmpD-associated family protein [unclassified Arenibacter]MCM4164643.1 hypothetical protein [Arenibacter sp. A80]RFT55722.1 hypothetical protein D0S24_13645 [Arenibacter sp. P308M17]